MKKNPHLNRPDKNNPAPATSSSPPRRPRVRRYRWPGDADADRGELGGSLHDTPQGRRIFRQWQRRTTVV